MPGVSQGKTVTLAPACFGQTQHGDAVVLDRFDGHEVHRIDAVRDVEQRVAVVRAWPACVSAAQAA